MKSIWNNKFYEEQPALGWTFKIKFENYYTGTNNIKLFEYLSDAIVDISVGKRESEYTSVYYGGLEFKKLTRAQNSNTFTIKFNENKNYTITSILESIYNDNNLNQLYYNQFGSAPYNNIHNVDPDTKPRKIRVEMYDQTLRGIETANAAYEFYNCQLMSIDDINFSYESTDTIVRSATFVYDFMQYEIGHKTKKGISYLAPLGYMEETGETDDTESSPAPPKPMEDSSSDFGFA